MPRPTEVVLRPSALFDPISRTDREGEVALVLLRPDDSVWLMIKRYYPPGAYRLPTGGIKRGEAIGAALTRETEEETSWRIRPQAYLADIRYRFELPNRAQASFRTHAFLLLCGDTTPVVLDADEEIANFRAVPLAELSRVAEFLDALPDRHSPEFGAWRDWGAFRAVVHRVVGAALTTLGRPPAT